MSAERTRIILNAPIVAVLALVFGGTSAEFGASPSSAVAQQAPPPPPEPMPRVETSPAQNAAIERQQEQLRLDAMKKTGILGMMLDQQAGRVVVTDVTPATPAEAAGIRKGDQLVQFGSHKITLLDSLIDYATEYVKRHESGEAVTALVRRGNEQLSFRLVPPPRQTANETAERRGYAVHRAVDFVFCMILQETEGGQVLVRDVVGGSPPQVAGITSGDLLVALNQEKINSTAHLIQLLALYPTGDKVTFVVNRNGKTIPLQLTIGPCHQVVPTTSPISAKATTKDLRDLILELQVEVKKLRTAVEVLNRNLK